LKSKKLFAILTLVAFMMTLVPVMAFGAVTPDPNASSFSCDDNVADADYDDTIKFTATVYSVDGGTYQTVAGQSVYFASSRGNSDKFVESDSKWPINYVGDNVYYVNTDANGNVEFKVKSLVPGTPVIGAALSNEAKPQNIFQYLNQNGLTSKDTIQLIGTKEIEFKADSAQEVNVYEVKVRDRYNSKNIPVTPTKDGDKLIYTGVTIGTTDWGKANELDYFEVAVKVTNKNGAPSADQQVEFSSDKTSCYFSDTKVNSDSAGIAKTKVYAKKGGKYEISFKCGSSTPESIFITFGPAEVSKVVLKSDDNRVLAKDSQHSWKFELQDALGNRIDLKKIPDVRDLIASIDAVEYPDNGDYKTTDWYVTADNDNNWLKIELSKAFTKEGSYKYRVTLKNGQYADFNFEIKKQGSYTGLKLTYDQSVMPMKAYSGKPTVTWVDAAGVEKDANDSNFANDGIRFSLNDYNKVDSFDEQTGVFLTTHEKDFVGDLLITAFDSSNKLSDSFKVTVSRELAGIRIADPTDKIEVGKVGVVDLKFVNIDGEQVAYGDAKEVEIENAYAISKPEGATISIEEGQAFAKGLKEKGEATLLVESNKAGDAVCFVNISITDSNNNTKYYTGTFKVSFGEPKKVVGGKTVVMFIGSTGYMQDNTPKTTDVAPFIQDSRTFVAIRPIAEAFGCEIGWNEATQTVTLTREDVTVTIVIGSNEIQVAKDGVVETVESDVAAFIKDGRTVLPFRACGNAFGATTNWDEVTQSVTYIQ
jgi:hypothetical protein